MLSNSLFIKLLSSLLFISEVFDVSLEETSGTILIKDANLFLTYSKCFITLSLSLSSTVNNSIYLVINSLNDSSFFVIILLALLKLPINLLTNILL